MPRRLRRAAAAAQLSCEWLWGNGMKEAGADAAGWHRPSCPLATSPKRVRSGRWLDAGLIPALVDHAASCASAGAAAPAECDSPTRRGAGDQAPHQRYAAAIASLIERAPPVRRAAEARRALRCVADRLGAGGGGGAPPLQLLLGLLDCAAGAQIADGAAAATPVPAAAAALLEAVLQAPLLLEALQALYARMAWHLPAAELLAKLKGAPVCS